jgi:radical SAM superfamily enzyme YgiQ (UPF0313 family)
MIYLVRPPSAECIRFSSTTVTPPLGLAYIAGALEAAGAQVKIIDSVAEAPTTHTRFMKGFLVGLRAEDIVERIPADAEFIGISAIFTHEWPAVTHLIDLLKKRHPNCFIVVGGEHVTAMPEFSLLTSRADALVLGEGEETAVALYQALKTKSPLSAIAGLVFRESEKIVVNPRRARRKTVDEIAWPAWHLFSLKTYHENRFSGGAFTDGITVPILATRGCPYQCTYCSSPNMWTTSWIPRSAKKVVDEIEFYVKQYGARNFPFQDLTAIIKKGWILDFCREILDRKLEITWQFPSGTRCEVIDKEVADLLRRSGMISMAYAPESGNEETRRFIKKKMQTDRLVESIEAAVSEKINISLFIVIGFPHDTGESVAANLPFVERAAKLGVTDVGVGFYMALPGTELFRSLYDAGKIKIDRSYFAHILQAATLFPSQTYCENLGPWRLAAWKLRLFFRFYRMKTKHASHAGLLPSVARAVKGLLSPGKEESRLGTAFRNGITNARFALQSWASPPWIPKSEENQLFARWDAIYRKVHEGRITAGVSQAMPRDTTQLHKTNVSPLLRREHETARTVDSNGQIVATSLVPSKAA